MPTLTRDAFLGGRVHAWQPRDGFRSGIDAVLLAAAVPAVSGQSVLDLGCGAGVAALCLNRRVGGLRLTGVEIQPAYADLARRNAQEADAPLEVWQADLRDLPSALRERQFDHVLTNPPYFDREAGSPAPEAGRDVARGGATTLAEWLDAATRRLAPGGVLTLIQRAERLPELMAGLDGRLGAVELMPLLPRTGQPARLVLLRARKGRRSPFVLRAPLVLHSGVRHGDADDAYAPGVEDVLRGGKALAGFEN